MCPTLNNNGFQGFAAGLQFVQGHARKHTRWTDETEVAHLALNKKCYVCMFGLDLSPLEMWEEPKLKQFMR